MSYRLLEKCTVPQKNSAKDILCSTQITVTQSRSQYRNNSYCMLDADDVKCSVRSVREWLEKYHEDVPNRLTLYFD